MALKPLTPPCKAPLDHEWALVAMEAGRTKDGVQTTLALFQGEQLVDSRNKIILADRTVRQTLAKAYGATTGCNLASIA
jgi:hypothetical protein